MGFFEQEEKVTKVLKMGFIIDFLFITLHSIFINYVFAILGTLNFQLITFIITPDLLLQHFHPFILF